MKSLLSTLYFILFVLSCHTAYSSETIQKSSNGTSHDKRQTNNLSLKISASDKASESANSIPQLDANFIFPLVYRGKDPGYFMMGYFMDHKFSTDYNCGHRTYRGHKGTDFSLWPFSWEKMREESVQVVAVADGLIVAKVDGNDDQSCGQDSSNYSLKWNVISILHDNGMKVIYGHLKKDSVTTKTIGSRVVKGEPLGFVGSSGRSSAPHLHFEVYDNEGKLIDPYAGRCNKKNTKTLWASPQPYRQSQINLLTTHSQQPKLEKCANKKQKPSLQTKFKRGESIYLTGYFRDSLTDQRVHYRLIKPSGSIYKHWTDTFEKDYDASYWYKRVILDDEAELGTWKLIAKYQGRVYEHEFEVY